MELGPCKVVAEKTLLIEKISIKSKSSTSQQDKRKDGLRASEEPGTIHYYQSCTSKTLCFKDKAPGHPAQEVLTSELIPGIDYTVLSYQGTEKSLQSQFKGSWLLLKPAADFLGLSMWCWFYRHAEFKSYGPMKTSTKISEESLESQAVCT